VGASYSFSF
jgi:hypothetical protein